MTDPATETGGSPPLPSEPETNRSARPVSGPLRWLYLLLAIVCLALGLLGVVLPVLPTTPFLLLMSYFLVRSSPALYARVVTWPVVGRTLDDWYRRGGVSLPVKWWATFCVVGVVGFSLFGTQLPPVAKAALGLLAVVGLSVVWSLPIARSDETDLGDRSH